MNAKTTSLSLLEAIRQGDADGWNSLVHLYGPLVYSWCRCAALSPEESRDVSQDVFGSVAQSIDRFRSQERTASFRRWLKTITLNRCRDFHRKHKEVARGGSTAMHLLANLPDQQFDSVQPHMSEDTAEQSFLLRRAAEMVRTQFEEKSWQAFHQVVIHSRAVNDVAADLDISPGAVRIAKCRVLAKLRQCLPELLEP
ncbi:MAG: sigma-70 family RNA polymerase sigma factor [Planctomycetota bacterium]